MSSEFNVCFMWEVSFTSTIELKSHKISVHNNVYWFHRVVLVVFIWTEYTGKYTPCSIFALFMVKWLSLLQKFLCFVVKFLVHRLIYFTRFPCYNCWKGSTYPSIFYLHINTIHVKVYSMLVKIVVFPLKKNCVLKIVFSRVVLYVRVFLSQQNNWNIAC